MTAKNDREIEVQAAKNAAKAEKQIAEAKAD